MTNPGKREVKRAFGVMIVAVVVLSIASFGLEVLDQCYATQLTRAWIDRP